MIDGLINKLHFVLGWFAVESDASGMNINTSKSEAIVLKLQYTEMLLPNVEEVKRMWVLFTSEKKVEQEIDGWLGHYLQWWGSCTRAVQHPGGRNSGGQNSVLQYYIWKYF